MTGMEEFRRARTPKEQAGPNLSGKRTVPRRISGETAKRGTDGVCGLTVRESLRL